MKNFVTPNSHPSSFFTGSTVESMIKKAKTLETGYYTCTDNGYLTNVLKAYNYAKKNDLKLIAGCELYFYDNELFAGTESERIKYFTVTVHAKTQEAYQFLVKKMSDQNKPTIKIIDQEYPLFDWKDLKEFSERDFTVTNGGPQCIISKHLLIDNKKAAFETFKRLHEYFGENFYASIMPHKFDRKWYASSVFTFTDGVEAELDSNIMAETDYAKTFRVPLKEVAENHGKHGAIKKVYVNGIGYDVNKNILNCINLKKFKKIGVDIYEMYNRFIKSMSERYGVKTIINDYSYFSNKDDKLVQDMKLGDDIRFAVSHHICGINEVFDTLSNIYADLEIEQMIQNSYEWASNFDNFELKYDYRLVKEHDDSLKATMDLIKELGRFDKSNPEHIKRLKHELSVIHSNGKIDLLPYFSPISKVINYYTDKGRVVGPARGSAGGSFLMYCMGITQIDPIKYDLYFSRFLTLGRILSGSLPDVDVDLNSRDLLVEKNGFFNTHYNERWAQVSTRTLMKLKSAVRDVNRYKHGKVEEEIEKFAKNLEATPQGVSDADFVFGYEDNEGNHVEGLLDKDESLQKYVKERPEEWEIVKRTLGISRQNGRHASAFVITDKVLTDIIPLMKVGGHENVTQYEAKEVEEAGLIKYDFLIVKVLEDIQLAIEKINKKHFYENGNKGGFSAGEFFHKGDIKYIWDLPEEQEVFDMLSEGKTETVFQLNTTSVTPFVKRIKPKSVEDCAVITSLVRPGPLDFVDERTGRNMAEEYIERVNGRSKGDIQILNDMLPETHGVMCIAKGSKVKTSNGQVNIENVKEGSFVQVETGDYKKVLKNIYQGKKETIKIRLDNSEELILTPDHKVLTQKGWVEAGSLNSNDLIKHFWVSDKSIEEGTDADWIVGMLLADGQLTQATYNIATGTEDKAIKIKNIIDKEFNIECKIYHHTRCWYVRTTNKNYINKLPNEKRKNPIKEYCKSIGIDGLNCYTKKFPNKITKKMIEGFIEGDGNVKNKRIRICNEKMARQIFETLQSLRIKSNLFKDKDVWTIGFNQSTLEYKIKKKPRESEKDIYIPKEPWKLNRNDNRRQHFCPKKTLEKPFIQRSLAKSIAKDYNFDVPNQTWSKVLKIEKDTIREVYDLSIEEVHSFVVGGNVVHNCFQEQITKITKELTGWDDEKAEDVRIAVGKKKLRMIEELKPQFIEASAKIGRVDIETAANVWGMIETFGRYGFNKSHAVAYAMIAYACAYLKHHYPLEWWAAVLSNADDKEITEVLWPHVKDILSPPDINLSKEEIVIDYNNGTLRSKLSVLKGIGEKAANKITEARPYKNINDFVEKQVVGHSLTKKLINVGVLDSLFAPKSSTMEKMKAYEDARQIYNYKKKIHEKSDGEISMSLNLSDFMEKAKSNPKTKRCKHQIKEGRVDTEYGWMDPIDDYLLKKSVFPNMLMNLYDILSSNPQKTRIVKTDKSCYAIAPDGREIRFVSGNIMNKIKKLDPDPTSKQIIDYAICGYVIDTSEFAYKNGERKAFKIIVDVDSYLEEFVIWPDRETGVLSYPEDLKKNSIVTLFLQREMKKQRYHTNINYLKVEKNG